MASVKFGQMKNSKKEFGMNSVIQECFKEVVAEPPRTQPSSHPTPGMSNPSYLSLGHFAASLQSCS